MDNTDYIFLFTNHESRHDMYKLKVEMEMAHNRFRFLADSGLIVDKDKDSEFLSSPSPSSPKQTTGVKGSSCTAIGMGDGVSNKIERGVGAAEPISSGPSGWSWGVSV